MTLPRTERTALAAAFGLLLLTLNGCNSSSTSNPSLKSAQAIDGYLVGATVYCDDVVSGGTAAGGYLFCPEGTGLIRIRGGADTGFDELASTSETAFVGELVAPGTLDYVTPLSSLAVALASTSGRYEQAQFAGAVVQLASALGLSSLDLNADAAQVLQLVKLNAQIHQVVSSFTFTADDYVQVTATLADLIRDTAVQQSTMSLVEGVSTTLADINSRLATTLPELALSTDALASAIERVTKINADIHEANTAAPVALAAASQVETGHSVSIDRQSSPIELSSYWFGSERPALADFESPQRIYNSSGERVYAIRISRGLAHMALLQDAFTVHRTLDDVQVGIGFEMVSTEQGSERKISITSTDVRLSMVKGDASSMQLILPEGTRMHVTSISANGTVTNLIYKSENERVFHSDTGGISVDLYRFGWDMERDGLGNITRELGNYRVTMVINGIKVSQMDNDESHRSATYSIAANRETVTGTGFQGYISIVDNW